MDYTQIILAIIGMVSTVIAGYFAAIIKRHNDKHDRSEVIRLKEIAVQNAVYDMVEYTAIALKNGHANGELYKLREELRKARNEYKMALLTR